MTFEIDVFKKEYCANYDYLYNSDDTTLQTELCNRFDAEVKQNKSFAEFVRKFCEFTQDFISSDREAAAFMLTVLEYNGTAEPMQA